MPWLAALGGAGGAAAGAGEAAAGAGEAAAAAAPVAEAAGATGAGASLAGTAGAGASMDLAAPAAAGAAGASGAVPLAGANAIAAGSPDATAGMGAGSVSTPGPWQSGYQFPTGPASPTPGSAVDGATTASDAGSTTGTSMTGTPQATDSGIWQHIMSGLQKGWQGVNDAADKWNQFKKNPIVQTLQGASSPGHDIPAMLTPPQPMQFGQPHRPQLDPQAQQLAMLQAFNLQA